MTQRALFVALILIIGSTAARAAEPQWQAGVAVAPITPAEPMWMGGYAARKKPAEGTLAELYAKALALQSGEQRIVIVTADLIGIPRSLAVNVSRRALKKYQLPRAGLLLNASHTHCGPELRPERDQIHKLDDKYSRQIAAYRETLETAIVDLIGDALQDLQPAKLSFAKSTAEFAKNRRYPTDKGYINRRYDEGPTDHDVPVLQVTSPAGKRRAILFGYACHNTSTGIMRFNGDYAGFAQTDIEQDFPGVAALFVAGTGGDQNPYPRGKIELARKHGRELADAVNRAVNGPQTEITLSLDTAFLEVALDFAPLPPREELEADQESKNVYRRRKADYLLGKLDRSEQIEVSYPCPIQAVRLGDQLLLVAIGGEVVVDYSRLVKAEFSSLPYVWVAGYSNDVFGYLPSARVLKEGGYEAGGAMLYGPLPGPFTDSVQEKVLEGVRRAGRKLGYSIPQQPSKTEEK